MVASHGNTINKQINKTETFNCPVMLKAITEDFTYQTTSSIHLTAILLLGAAIKFYTEVCTHRTPTSDIQLSSCICIQETPGLGTCLRFRGNQDSTSFKSN